jgi:hypothetical protein
MNVVFFLLVLISVLAAAFGTTPENDLMAAVGKAALDGAKSSVDLAISLIGAMTLFLGLMKVVETTRIPETKELAKLAPEPFSEKFSSRYFAEQIRSSSRVLKEILLDQTKVCGVGNIYASEAMFLAGIHPKKRGKALSAARCSTPHEYVKAVRMDAIEQAALIEPHPALRAASPQASPADMYLGDDFHHNGAFRLSYGFEYAAMMESAKDVQQFKFDKYDTYEWYLNLGSLANVNEKYLKGKIPTWNDYVNHPNYDAFWQRQAAAQYLKQVRVPTLNVAGWWD